jgi:exopolysaccharide biosynthesis protein
MLPATWLLQVAFVFSGAPAAAMPVVTPLPPMVRSTHTPMVKLSMPKSSKALESHNKQPLVSPAVPQKSISTLTTTKPLNKHHAQAKKQKHATKACSVQSVRKLAAGLIYKTSSGKQLVNLLDIDMSTTHLQVVPVMADNCFDRLEQVRQQAQKVRALAAINANYFKRDGTPLGALIKDGEWIAGPLYQRTALGITADGRVLVDKVGLNGTLSSSNSELTALAIDSINQPRIHGSKLVVYTPRWGKAMHMPYAGILVAVDSNSKVINKATTTLAIPPGGFVLSDKKGSSISKLQIGDLAHISWHATPEPWNNVIQSVSGGPVLLRDGKIVIDCRSEKFPASWSGTGIKARTIVGVTANHHMIMATLEGKHTLYDAARLLQSLGVKEALNLDGGGSTTMIVSGQTVTRNCKGSQRCVSTALAVLDEDSPAAFKQKKEAAPLSKLAAVPH